MTTVIGFLGLSALLALSGCDGSSPPDMASASDMMPADCVGAGGSCASGGRCPTSSPQRYPSDNAALSATCPGGASSGAVCCVTCQMDATSPGVCCSATASFIPICVGGKVGCAAGQTGKPAGSSCP